MYSCRCIRAYSSQLRFQRQSFIPLIAANITYALIMVVTGFLFAMRGLRGAITTERCKKGFVEFCPDLRGAAARVVPSYRTTLRIDSGGSLPFCFLPVCAEIRFFIAETRLFDRCDRPDLAASWFSRSNGKFGGGRKPEQVFCACGNTGTADPVLLPFITGMLTGITVGFVGSTSR